MTAAPQSFQQRAETLRQPWSGNLSADLRKGALSVNADGLTLIDEKGVCWGIIFPDKTGSYEHVPLFVEAVNGHEALKARVTELEDAYNDMNTAWSQQVDEIVSLKARIHELETALRFYSDGRRYQGANQKPIPDDPYAKPDAVYILDVMRDLGAIATRALKGAA